MADDITTIQIHHDTWQELHSRKGPGDSFEDVIRRELGLDGAATSDEPPAEPAPEPEARGEAYADADLPAALAAEIDRYEGELRRAGTDHVDDRVAAAEAVGRMLVAEGGVSRSEAQGRLLPQYDVSGMAADTWWQRAGKDRFARVDSIEWSQTEQHYVEK